MEEARNYMFALLSVLLAAGTAYSVLWTGQYLADKGPKARALRTSLVILIFTGGISGMHMFGVQAAPGISLTGSSLLISLSLYALTLALMIWLFHRISQMLAEREQLKELAYRDRLTGLFNKNGMDHFWNHCKSGEQLAVLYLDLNRFKSINDKLGHHIGDLLLQAVGGSLQQFSSKGKRHIFRVGGDEFVIIAKRCSYREAEQLALKVLERTTRNYQLERHELFVSASIGITASQGAVDPIRLLKEADSAMYTAKQLGRGRYAVHKQGNVIQPVNWLGRTKAN
ncbi:GGDEF domain-containing protein [Paenibacillus camerounensis]|uniref:GGDEF domain-containing protein n=1 Tax=Paenibacillus camerounensis TaxID=1243663 RepID=UPI0006949690|nr:GGDEF domain-containing protein [Paenibacillus camerounensis]